MEYRMLGKSDLKISRIGFGTMSLEPDHPYTEALLHRALEGGINYFDTADIYLKGLSETILGRAFRGKRDKVILATKVGNQWKADGSGWDWNPTKKYILKAAEQSLKRLQTDHIDLYQLHGGTLADPVEEIIETFELLRAAGKIRYYGISSIRPNVIREYVNRSSIISVMMQYSLLDRRPEEEMLSLLMKNQVGVLARGSVAKGLLISKTPAPYLNYSAEEAGKAKQAIGSVSDMFRRPFDSAVQFVLNNPAVPSAVIGIRTNEQLSDALAVFDSPPMNAVQMESLRNVLPVNKYTEHR
jgi:aryl-alcohol dehydrogenase-like predicted oxidoreductase